MIPPHLKEFIWIRMRFWISSIICIILDVTSFISQVKIANFTTFKNSKYKILVTKALLKIYRFMDVKSFIIPTQCVLCINHKILYHCCKDLFSSLNRWLLWWKQTRISFPRTCQVEENLKFIPSLGIQEIMIPSAPEVSIVILYNFMMIDSFTLAKITSNTTFKIWKYLCKWYSIHSPTYSWM